MQLGNFDFDQWDGLRERRAYTRTKIDIQAKIIFSPEKGPLTCAVRDATNRGAGILADSIKLLTLSFELSFDNFRTVRDCRLIWRNGNLFGVAFRN